MTPIRSLIALSLITLILCSCGQNAEQKAIEQKAIMDSVQKATANQIQQQEAAKNRLAELKQKKEQIKEVLITLRSDLEAQGVKILLLKVFNF